MRHSLFLLALFSSASVLADSSSPVIDSATINNSGQQYNGNVMVNQAAGDQQQQLNSRAIAVGTNASATTSSAGNLRSSRMLSISRPTLPVAPTTATL